jgi:uncharacterized protein YqjF (DUF2071 family)
MQTSFLQAEWRKLAMANYVIDKNLLSSYIPYKTELDLHNEKCYVSLVGFMFMNTRLKGCKIPFHINFQEVNLRFYVRYKDNGEWKRGVVFIKEIVPRAALTFVANRVYKENYETMRMTHFWEKKEQSLFVEYKWKKKNWHSFIVVSDCDPVSIKEGSDEEFITEHYWGYTRINDQKTSEYRVEHPRWDIYPVNDYAIRVDFAELYGHQFAYLIDEKPESVFLAEGSEIIVKGARKL